MDNYALWIAIGLHTIISISFFSIFTLLIEQIYRPGRFHSKKLLLLSLLLLAGCGIIPLVEIWFLSKGTDHSGQILIFAAIFALALAVLPRLWLPKVFHGLDNQLRDLTLAEERYRLAVESAPNAMVMIDEEGKIVLVNRETERLFGYRRDELLNHPVELLVPEESREIHPELRNKYFENPVARAMGAGRDLYGQHREGSKFPVEIGLNPVVTKDGKFVLSAIVDITDRKEAEQRFQIAVESAPNAMVMVDDKGRIVMVNSETEYLFGYERKELLGQPVEILVPPRFRDSHPRQRDGFFKAPIRRAMGEGRDLFGVRSDGSEFPVEIGLNPITTGSKQFVLSSIIDNTERGRILDEVRNQNEEMQQLLYTVSHDLKSPLVTIQGFAGLLEDKVSKGELDSAKDYSVRIQRAIHKMAVLINDLLELSRVARQNLDIEEVDVTGVLEDVSEALTADFARSRATLVIETGLPTVQADRNRLYQIFQNLISNALKYGCDDPDSTVYVGCRETKTGTDFYVRDEGAGIAEEFHRKIFQLFHRVRTDREGTGLGLAIVAKIVRLLGGRVRVDSEPGKGATFWFSIPRHGWQPTYPAATERPVH